MEHAIPHVVLNEPQRKHLAVLLMMLEEAVAEVEQIAAAPAAQARLVAAERDVPPEFARLVRPYCERIRARLVALADQFGLEARSVSDARRIQALLVISIVRIEDSFSGKLRGYGKVDPSVAQHLDPALKEIRAMLSELAALLAPTPAR